MAAPRQPDSAPDHRGSPMTGSRPPKAAMLVAQRIVRDIGRAGLRPGTPDNAPAIGPAELDGLHWATGHYRHGVLLAPLTADLVVDGVTDVPPRADAALLAPGRFGAGARTEVPA